MASLKYALDISSNIMGEKGTTKQRKDPPSGINKAVLATEAPDRSRDSDIPSHGGAPKSENRRITLAEVVDQIKKQQGQKIAPTIKELEELTSSTQKNPIRESSMGQSYQPSAAIGPYGGVMMARLDPYKKDNWYNPSESKQSGPSDHTPNIGLSSDEVKDIMEDAKMKSWGLGGNGKHRSLHTQQVYDVVRFTTASFAMNQIIYRLALN